VIPNFRTRTIQPDVTVAEISGRLNLGNTLQSIESALHKLIDDGARKLVIDLAELTYIDSAGLGMLIECNGRIEQAGGSLCIAGAKGVVAASFAVAHIERILDLHDSVDAAGGSF
jgi:anti-sigma B factor antagonist